MYQISLFYQTSRGNYQENETHQLEIIQGSEGQASEVDISNQPQILITQGSGSGRDEGKRRVVQPLCRYQLFFLARSQTR